VFRNTVWGIIEERFHVIFFLLSTVHRVNLLLFSLHQCTDISLPDLTCSACVYKGDSHFQRIKGEISCLDFKELVGETVSVV
jgi:hypothetical protein